MARGRRCEEASLRVKALAWGARRNRRSRALVRRSFSRELIAADNQPLSHVDGPAGGGEPGVSIGDREAAALWLLQL